MTQPDHLSTFLKLANIEFDALQEYCNSFSGLSHALSNSSSNQLDSQQNSLQRMKSFQSSSISYNDALMNYSETLEDLRTSHSKLKSYTTEVDASLHPVATKLYMDHIALSARCLQTCASSTHTVGFGPIHENGLIKNLKGDGNVDWHAVRVVSLASLRANIERIKSDLE